MEIRPSILVVDDEPNNFDVIETHLESEAYQLNYAPDGEQALERLNDFLPDVILLDVMMPGLDGMEVCRRIKAMPQWRSVPIIMVTALTTKEDLSHCLAAGADDFISKPVNRLELRARVRSMLRIKQQYDSLQTLSECQEDTIQLLQNTLSELRGNVARALPHEFNTPLNGIAGTLGLLLNEYSQMSPEKVQAFLKLARQSALRLERLAQRFLDYVQLELKELEYKNGKILTVGLEPLPAQTLLLDVAQRQAQSVDRLSDLVCRIEPMEVPIKAEDLECILVEVLDNAFKFSKPKTPVQLMAKLLGDQMMLSISNQGRGMTNEQVEGVGAFMQFDRRMHEQQGAGLGLAIASKMTKLYGGFLSIQNEIAGELTVHITIPTRQ